MKVFKNYFFVNKIYNLKLIKNKVLGTNKTVIFFRIFFKLIFKFHVINKRLLFLFKKDSVFSWFCLFLKKGTKHLIFENIFWKKGFLSNFFLFKQIYMFKQFSINFRFKNDVNLIVNLNDFLLFNDLIKSRTLHISFSKSNFTSLNKYQNNLILLLIYQLLKI